jgi:S1-C subfamily serine protease
MVLRRLLFIGILAATASLAGTARTMFQQRAPVWIGVGFNAETLNPSPEGTKAKTGLRVGTVVFDSPAEKAGVLINDLIVGVDGQEFTAEPAVQDKQFRESVLRRAPGDPIILTLVRGADVKDLQLTV